MRKLTKSLSFISLILTLFLLGCQSEINKNYDRISEIRDELLLAKGTNFSVEIISGVRENPFNIDGKSNGKQDFTVITVKGEFSIDSPVQYCINYNGARYDGTLDKHPLKNSYSTELNIAMKGEVNLSVIYRGNEERVVAKSVKTDQTITANRALEIARVKMGKKLDNGEIYIRYIINPISTAKAYYYYVAVCPNESEVYAVLIDEISGEIVATRE